MLYNQRTYREEGYLVMTGHCIGIVFSMAAALDGKAVPHSARAPLHLYCFINGRAAEMPWNGHIMPPAPARSAGLADARGPLGQN
jgi:hypothetical protein